MAVVMTWTTPRGTKIEFCDDAYAGCSEEEIARRTREIQQTAWAAWARLHQIRRAARQTSNERARLADRAGICAAQDAGTSGTAEG